MAGGPPSSIEIGDGYGDYGYSGGSASTNASSSSLTYYERTFGGYGEEDFDPSFIPSYTPTDKGERELRQGRFEEESARVAG